MYVLVKLYNLKSKEDIIEIISYVETNFDVFNSSRLYDIMLNYIYSLEKYEEIMGKYLDIIIRNRFTLCKHKINNYVNNLLIFKCSKDDYFLYMKVKFGDCFEILDNIFMEPFLEIVDLSVREEILLNKINDLGIYNEKFSLKNILLEIDESKKFNQDHIFILYRLQSNFIDFSISLNNFERKFGVKMENMFGNVLSLKYLIDKYLNTNIDNSKFEKHISKSENKNNKINKKLFYNIKKQISNLKNLISNKFFC